MSHLKHYIEKSLLMPEGVKKTLSEESVFGEMEQDISCFMDTYAPMEAEILNQVNIELEILNAQIKTYLRSKESESREQEMRQIEQEIAYL